MSGCNRTCEEPAPATAADIRFVTKLWGAMPAKSSCVTFATAEMGLISVSPEQLQRTFVAFKIDD